MDIAGQNEYVRVFQNLDLKNDAHNEKLKELFSEVISNTMIYLKLAGVKLEHTDESVREFVNTLKQMPHIVFQK
jgi:hypothetical protein